MCWSLAVRERVPPMSRRINYTGQQKIAILREHLIEDVPVLEHMDSFHIKHSGCRHCDSSMQTARSAVTMRLFF